MTIPQARRRVERSLESFHEHREVKNATIQDLYICAGNRSYMVGSQNGDFPDFGHHVQDEMGGLWNHPIKLLDGFWLRVSEQWLEKADSFHNFPYYNEHHYSLPSLNLEIVRHQFCPDDVEGFVITYRIRDTSGQARQLPVDFLGRTDLSPVWFSEHAGIEDGADEGRIDWSSMTFRARDSLNPWFAIVGSDLAFLKAETGPELFGPHPTSGQGTSGLLSYLVHVPANGEAEIRFFISGSYHSEVQAVHVYEHLKQNHSSLLEAKRKRYESLLNKTVISIPDEQLGRIFDWVKFHNDWLIREVPEIGRGLGAGHPEYPWWFGCDNSYALLGLLPVGQQRLALETSDLIRSVSEQTNGNGRIIHELSTCNVVANPGNTQETPHYIQSVWELFLWTGDIEFLRNAYPTVKKGIAWLLDEMDPDGDLLPEGYGIIEIEGLNVELIDTAVYTWSALNAGAKMAELFGEQEIAEQYRDTAVKLGDKINQDLWLKEEGLYADAMAPVGMVLERMPLYIERARSSDAEHAALEMEAMQLAMSGMDKEAEHPWLFKNWVINTPMEMGLAPRDQALRALDRMGTDEFTGPSGTYLSGMYRTNMMTISTGVQAVAEARYDRMDEALRYIRLIASTFNKRLPGSISEMSPDYGCFVQAWTNYGLSWTVMRFMFGIQPEAHSRKLNLRPRLPKEWNEASVDRVELGLGDLANELDFSISLGQESDVYRISMKQNSWTVVLNLPNAQGAKLLLDGEPVKPDLVDSDGSVTFTIERAGSHEVRVERG
ncbi:glycogen debranching protein [Cohnella endophytica]|uniref:Glycogen debranching protein n=1 Tax=Cohnella endophytica TaxID=2419778 RepID=A0A494X7M6_9BACL|nr:glycogen debranching protein [Cohnella endophytica]RKP46707.1 glycogen debranching protein [Cohnella endophytica]